ncbi:MAG: ABC transporter substrate-binding protein [Gemmatimonadetes bacterium]|nr:ABC transporter substrate-binding protein [Gemmatimonadota bacterium]
MATQASAITFIGTTGQAFDDGMEFIQVYLPQPLVMVLLCVLFVPFFYRAKVYTAYEYLETRFDAKTRSLTAFLFLISRGLAAGLVLYAPAIVLSVIFGWDEVVTILIMGAVTIAYTTMGGITAVIWTDVVQMLMMFAGIAAAVAILFAELPAGVGVGDVVYIGGIQEMWSSIDLSWDPSNTYTIWSGMIGGFFLALAYFGTDQSQVQRYLTASSLTQSRLSLIFNAFLKVPMQFFILSIGVLLFVFYHFERPPLVFNAAEVAQVEASGVAGAYRALEAQQEELHGLRRQATLDLLAVREAGGDVAAARDRIEGFDGRLRALRTEAKALVAEAERLQNRRIELVVADDAGGARLGAAVRELERRGAVAIVGPMLPEQISAAAGARANQRLVLISPTSTVAPRWPEAYSVNSSDPRGAQELGRYTAEVGLRRAAVLYPRMEEFEQKARAFAAEYEARGGEIRAMVPYDSGTTTFGSHMRRIEQAMAPAGAEGVAGEPVESWEGAPGPRPRPFALFVPAPPRDVQQIAPQIDFYGLDAVGVQVIGDEAWASAEVRRLVPNRDIEGVIAASRFPPERSSAGADPAFVEAYEARYQRSLENQLPALGYDAAHLVMQALPNRLSSPDAFARRFHLLAGIPGATGLLSVRASRVVRTPYLVVIRDGELAPAPRMLDHPAGVGQ